MAQPTQRVELAQVAPVSPRAERADDSPAALHLAIALLRTA